VPVEVGEPWRANEARWCTGVLLNGRTRNQVTTTVIPRARLQEVFAIRSDRRRHWRVRHEMLVIEHERQRNRDVRFGRAIDERVT